MKYHPLADICPQVEAINLPPSSMRVRECEVITDDSTVIARLRTNSAAWDFVDRQTGETRSPKEHLAASLWRQALNRWNWADQHY